ncbi:uncharacterized protein LOC119995423 [Tripterygium wilfordii]|uniref:uncharacterized protein LOC119995423 n=1 Tax=Tripterygium wilfordii TaxID=458696 RepID=UPI0018F83530|nr:uncharacterized protein LOC119995423 [Tripterygium wilfordii]
MAGLIIGDLGQFDKGRDIIVEYQTGKLKQISDLHPTFMAIQYPILFQYGKDGYKINILYQFDTGTGKMKREFVTRREYYCYMLQQRSTESQLFIRGGILLQQYIVDAFTSIEDERLLYIRFKYQQEHYISEIYKGVQNAFLHGDISANTIGKRIILSGSPCYMIQHYHDAMAICHSLGNHDLFITFTCNKQWKEICDALNLILGQRAEDRPDIVSRVFHMKLIEFMKDIKQENYFDRAIGGIHTIEFQKKSLPHVHIIVWLHPNDKYSTTDDINEIICAEILDKQLDPILYNIVSTFMIHGPCGVTNPKAPYMRNQWCTKHFPKKYSSEILIADDGFVIYRRCDDNRTIVKEGVKLDNRFVVPYNKGLLLKYQAHVNVEWCNRSRSIKYLFKYINKGPDRARAMLHENIDQVQPSSSAQSKVIDEIQTFLDCRYLTAYESIWTIFDFDIHYKFHAVQNLTIHLPLMNNIIFQGDQNVDGLLHQLGIEKTMLTEWMSTNCTAEDACQLTYAEFPSFWRWDGKNKFWFRRQRGECIGGISYVPSTVGELYYLRLLLGHMKGPTNYIDIRTFNGILYDSFQETCNAMVLIDNDHEWHDAMDEAAT